MSVAVGPTSFSCPHCAVNYPFKAVLVGKAIRCKSCSGVFKLRPDGLAERIAESGEVPAAPVSGEMAKPPAETSKDRTRSGRLQATVQQEDLRKQMAASLAESMGKALDSDAVKKEEKKAKTESQKGSSSGSKKPSAKVVLSGDGERAADNDRRWLLGSIAVVLVLAGLIWLINRENAREKALDAFIDEVAASDNVYGRRAQALVARAWITAPALNRPGVEPVIGIDQVKFGPISSIPSLDLASLVKLKGQRYHRDLGVWADPNQIAAVKAHKVSGTSATAVLKGLQSAGVDEAGIAVLDQLLHGEPSPTAKDLLIRLAGDQPPTVRFCTITGPQASILIDIGGGYRIRSGPFTATLVALDGPGWPGQWRVLEFTLTQPDR